MSEARNDRREAAARLLRQISDIDDRFLMEAMEEQSAAEGMAGTAGTTEAAGVGAYDSGRTDIYRRLGFLRLSESELFRIWIEIAEHRNGSFL